MDELTRLPRRTPREDLAPWRGMHITGLDRAEAMFRANFTADTADTWYGAVAATFSSRDPGPPSPSRVARCAAMWRVAGFAPEEVAEWCEAFAKTDCSAEDLPVIAHAWRMSGCESEGAWWWNHVGIQIEPVMPDCAAFFEAHDWSPDEVHLLALLLTRWSEVSLDATIRAWVLSGLKSHEALDFVKAGVSIDEARELLATSSFWDLEESLREREGRLPKFELSVGTLINNLVRSQYGRPGHDAPLHQAHVWDALDEESENERVRRAEARFGRPNADGVYLVAVVEFSADSDEDGWTYADMMARGSVALAAEQLGWKRTEVDFGRAHVDPAVGTLPDGTRLAATTTTREGTQRWYRESREPTELELERWAEPRATDCGF